MSHNATYRKTISFKVEVPVNTAKTVIHKPVPCIGSAILIGTPPTAADTNIIKWPPAVTETARKS